MVSKEVNFGSTNRLVLRAKAGCAFDSPSPLRVAYAAASFHLPQSLLGHWHKARQCAFDCICAHLIAWCDRCLLFRF